MIPIGPLQIYDRDNPWRSMDCAPKTVAWVEVKVWNNTTFKNRVYIAHWACGGGEEQPPFIGWFEAVLRSDGEATAFFRGIPDPWAWRPLSQPEFK